MPFANNSGVRIYWRIQGASEKPVLVLLNSIGTEQGVYDQVAPDLLQDFRLLRIDNRGHGASDAPVGEYTLDELAGDTLAVMDAAGIDKAIVCGTSLGGMIAMALVLKARKRVRGLILANTSAKMDPAFWTERIAMVRTQGMGVVSEIAIQKFFSPAFLATQSVPVDTARATLQSTSPHGYAGCAAAIRGMDFLPHLHAVSVPTMVIASTQDAPTPFEGHGHRIAAAIPGALSRVLDCGHLACVEEPQAFATAVRDLAARCAPNDQRRRA